MKCRLASKFQYYSAIFKLEEYLYDLLLYLLRVIQKYQIMRND